LSLTSDWNIEVSDSSEKGKGTLKETEGKGGGVTGKRKLFVTV